MDATGDASTRLMRLIGYTGSAVAFARLLSAMDRDGEIVRQMKGSWIRAIFSTAPSRLGQNPSARDTGPLLGAGERRAYLRRLERARSQIDVLFGHAPQDPRRPDGF